MSAKGLGAPKPPDMSDPDLKDAIDLAKRLARTREVTTEGMDEMANRIFNEINREIERLEESKQDADFQERAADARSLAQLQRTLTEAIRLRRDRDAHKETRSSKKNADPRGRIISRLDRRAAQKPEG